MSNAITWGYIARHLPMITVQCDRCGRRGRYSTAKLIVTYGADATVQGFQRDLTKDCPQKNDPRYAFGMCAPLLS